jgi:protein-S-isoprenylcysteine O-methyltransferase Ste14
MPPAPCYIGAMKTATRKAFSGFCGLVAVMAALLFAGAGTLAYWQAWVFLAAYFGASLALTLYLMAYDPALLARRMRGGPTAEKAPAQRIIMTIASLGFVTLLLLPALDHRFGWSHMPPAAALGGDGTMLLGWLAIFFVFKENSFTASTIEVAPDQRVVSTGPYARVRHPMYAGAFVMLAGIPVALGSWWGLLAMAAIVPAVLWRLIDEEKFLARNLPGYVEYQRTVRYRLIPLAW